MRIGKKRSKFPIKFDCFLKIMSSGSNLRHLIKKHSSHRCAVISNIKNLHTVLIPFNGLVKIRYNIKHIQILDPAPVNGIRNLDCCLIVFLAPLSGDIHTYPINFPRFLILPGFWNMQLPVLRLQYGTQHLKTAH